MIFEIRSSRHLPVVLLLKSVPSLRTCMQANTAVACHFCYRSWFETTDQWRQVCNFIFFDRNLNFSSTVTF